MGTAQVGTIHDDVDHSREAGSGSDDFQPPSRVILTNISFYDMSYISSGNMWTSNLLLKFCIYFIY